MTLAVEASGLVKRYGAQRAVDDLALQVPAGSVFGLLGPNGAGKSTTFGLLCGWLRPDSGASSVLGVPSSQLHRLRGRVTALPQDARFPDAVPIRAQLAHFARLTGMAPAAAAVEAGRVLDAVGLSDAAAKRGDQLSHGMVKRAGIAQALIGRPAVVFLDEPTAGLDPQNARQLRDLIVSLAPETTVVISSHNLAEIEDICTHGAIIAHGRLVRHGTIADLTRQGNEFVVQVRPGCEVPLSALRARFGDGAVESEGALVRIRHRDPGDAADVIGAALRILIDAGTPILGVSRGTSLETAFLEMTGDRAPS